MSFTVILALLMDTKQTKKETVITNDAITAMTIAERNNPEWISVSAELDAA